MAEANLIIKVDSSQAKSGASEVKAELSQIKALFADVVSLSQTVGVDLGRSMTAALGATTRATDAVEKSTRAHKSRTAAVETEAEKTARLNAMVAASITEYEKTNNAAARAEVASKKYAVALDSVRSSAGAGTGTFSSLTAALDAYDQKAGAASARTAEHGASATKAAGGMHTLRFAAQQAGYQFADLAIVMGSGNASFGQAAIQIGQLAGAFGAWGAVIGAGVTIGGVMADTILRSGNAAKEAAAKQKEYNAALEAGQGIIDRYVQALDRVNGKGENWRADRNAVIDLQAELGKLQSKRDQMVKDSAFFRTSNPLGLAYDAKDFSEIDLQISLVREKIFQTQKAIVETPALTIGAAVRPGTLDLADLKRQQVEIENAVAAAASANSGKGDETKLKSLTETYEALSFAVATYASESQKAALRADAQAKAATMGDAEGKKYLATRNAEIDLMGKAVVAGERENTMRAASVGVLADQSNAYSDAQRQIALAAVDSNGRLAATGIDAEKQRISQRRALLEISAVEELALQREQDDRKRQVELETAQQRLAVLKRVQPQEYTAIDSAERAITEMRSRHGAERQKQLDAESSARAAMARKMAQIEAEAVSQQMTAALSVKQENLSFGVSMGGMGTSEIASQERAIAEERYQIERDLLEKKLALAGIEEDERARINGQIVALERQRSLTMQQIDHKETLQRKAEIREWVQPWKAGIQAVVSAWMSGAADMSSVVKSALASIPANYIGKGVGAVADKAATSVVTSVAGADAAAALGLGDGGQTAALATNTTAINGLTAALTGNTTATATGATAATANATATTTNAAATTANTGIVSAGTVATAANTTATITNAGTQVASLVTNTAGEGVNTGATLANTAALSANTAAQGGSAVGGLGGLFSFFASGTRSAPAGPAIVGEEGPEVMVDGAGRARLLGANGPEFAFMSGGEQIYTASATRRMLSAADGVTIPGTSLMSAKDNISVPSIISNPMGGSTQTVNNMNASSASHTFHISPTFVQKQAITDADIRRHSRAIAKAVRDQTRDFDPSTRR